MDDRIPECFEDQLKKMRNVVYVMRAYKPDSCLDDIIIAYNVPDSVSSFLGQCTSCLDRDSKKLQGGYKFHIPAGMVQQLPNFRIFSDNNIEIMSKSDMMKLLAVQKYCL